MKWMLLGMYVAAAADIVVAAGVWWLVVNPPDCLVLVKQYLVNYPDYPSLMSYTNGARIAGPPMLYPRDKG